MGGIAEVLSPAQLQAGIDANNARAMDPAGWRLRWLHLSVVPTGSFFTVHFEVPESAAMFRLEYLFAWWPVTGGVFRQLYAELIDDRGIKFTDVKNTQNKAVSFGAKFSLFTSPTTDPDSATAGDQSKYLGAMPLNIEFPGRAQISINIRGALATPDPANVELVLVGHLKNKVKR